MILRKQITDNIESIDILIGKAYLEIENTDDQQEIDNLIERIDKLVEIRDIMTDSKTKESHLPMIFSGLVQLSSILLVLQYEKTDVVTSSAFNMANKLFKKG